MSFKKNNNVWYDLFKGFMSYLKKEKYPLNNTGIEVLRIVDYINEPVSNELNESYINVNVAGNSYVKEDHSIYDNTKTLVLELSQGDTFIIDAVTYFIDSSNEVHELNEQWSNTTLGDNGISVSVGDFDIEDNKDVNTWRLPQLQIAFDNIQGVNATERRGITTPKAFTFEIFMIVKEKDLYENISGYDEMYRVDSLLNDLMYNYFNSSQCAHDIPISTLTWVYDLEIISEMRPAVISVKTINLTFR